MLYHNLGKERFKAVVKKRARLSIDVSPEERRRIRLAAAMHDSSIREYVLEAIQERLTRDLETKDREGLLTLTAKVDPVLAELWNNEKDAAYDRL
jgi:uncharacterized protein (DUF1778 family)